MCKPDFRDDIVFEFLQGGQEARCVRSEVVQNAQARTEGVERDAILGLNGLKIFHQTPPDKSFVHEAGVQRVEKDYGDVGRGAAARYQTVRVGIGGQFLRWKI